MKLELFTVNPSEGKTIAYGRRLADLSQNSTDPDTVARSLLVSGCKPAILHSTSWRWEKNGTLILTYLAFSEDPNCLAAEPSRLSWSELFPPQSTDPQKPRPAEIREQDVLSHGIRHITFLVRYSQDRRIAEALSRKPAILFAHVRTACRSFGDGKRVCGLLRRQRGINGNVPRNSCIPIISLFPPR